MFWVHIILILFIGTLGFYFSLNLSRIYLTQEKWIKIYFKQGDEQNENRIRIVFVGLFHFTALFGSCRRRVLIHYFFILGG